MTPGRTTQTDPSPPTHGMGRSRPNNAERTWECPCHGSRFGIDGEILQVPALSPLERHDPDEL